MSAVLAEHLYVGVLWLATPFALLRLWWRGRAEPLYRHAWWERLGFYRGLTAVACPPTNRPLWLHAVSLGETRAAEALIQVLRAANPLLRIVLTHSTATGREAGRALLRQGDVQVWFPYDTPGAVGRFLAHFQPAAVVMMETEVWPSLCKVAAGAGIPVILANARLSEKSLRRGRRFRALLGAAASRLTLVLAQTPEDAQRIRQMGAPSIQVAGNVKYDMTPNPDLLDRGRRWRLSQIRPLLVAASTREGEERQLLAAWRACANVVVAHGARLCIVPRHPQRFNEVADLIVSQGFTLSRRSQWPGNEPGSTDGEADVWLGDSVGEMPAYYAAAHVGLLGGSFEPFGGQNLIEAAVCGCPLLIGPSTFNFALAATQSLDVGASMRCHSMTEAVAQALALMVDGHARESMSQAGVLLTSRSKGAAKRQAQAILGCMEAIEGSGLCSGVGKIPVS